MGLRGPTPQFITPNRCRYLLAVETTGSVKAAAEALGVDRSAVGARLSEAYKRLNLQPGTGRLEEALRIGRRRKLIPPVGAVICWKCWTEITPHQIRRRSLNGPALYHGVLVDCSATL